MLFAFAVAAWAHDPVGEVGYRPFVREGALVGAWTSSGIALRDPDGTFARVCNESLTGVSDVWLRPDGVFLLATVDGLVRAPDGGCVREPDPQVAERVSILRDVDGVLVLAVVRDDGDALLRSDDGGESFVEVGALPVPTQIETLAAGGDGRWWVTGQSGGNAVFVSDDGGATFEQLASPDPWATSLRAFGPAPDGVGIAVASWALFGDSRIWVSDGVGWAPIVDLPLVPVGYGCAGGACFASLGLALVSWDPSVGDDSLRLADGPWTCVSPLADAVWGCNPRRSPALFASTTDGVEWTDVLPTSELVDRICPPGTEGQVRCPSPIGPFDTGDPGLPAGDDDDDGPALSPEPDGCGCATGRAAMPWWVALWLVRRRRGR